MSFLDFNDAIRNIQKSRGRFVFFRSVSQCQPDFTYDRIGPVAHIDEDGERETVERSTRNDAVSAKLSFEIGSDFEFEDSGFRIDIEQTAIQNWFARSFIDHEGILQGITIRIHGVDVDNKCRVFQNNRVLIDRDDW